jgi:hypothetical protein
MNRRRLDAIILRNYTAEMIDIIKPHGTWIAPDPAPLSVEEMVPMLKAGIEASNYRGQTLSLIAEDGRKIRIHKGDIEIEDPKVEHGWKPFDGSVRANGIGEAYGW